MKIFKSATKINFIDKNNTFVGFDSEQNCCEGHGWFIADKITLDIEMETDQEDKQDIVSDYIFDIGFFCAIKSGKEFDIGGMAVFRLKCEGKKYLFLHLYNSHNGYYYHGFIFKDDHNIFREDSL